MKIIIAILSILTIALACTTGYYIIQTNQANKGDFDHSGKVDMLDLNEYLQTYSDQTKQQIPCSIPHSLGYCVTHPN